MIYSDQPTLPQPAVCIFSVKGYVTNELDYC